MNRRKPLRVDPKKHADRARTVLAGSLAALVALALAACSSTGSTSPTSSPTVSASTPTTAANTTNSSATAGPTTIVTTKPRPVAHCPAIKPMATPQVPLECTSAATIGAAAARVGLIGDRDRQTILPILYLLAYSRTVFLPVDYRREVNIFHYSNGAVASLLCAGVVAKTVDPALGVCLDNGPSTRTDRPAVRAWVLRAEATISKSAKAQPTLTSGKLTFVACANLSYPKTSDKTVAFEINVYIQHSGSSPPREDCAR